jgi:hypothetical protein
METDDWHENAYPFFTSTFCLCSWNVLKFQSDMISSSGFLASHWKPIRYLLACLRKYETREILTMRVKDFMSSIVRAKSNWAHKRISVSHGRVSVTLETTQHEIRTGKVHSQIHNVKNHIQLNFPFSIFFELVCLECVVRMSLH